MLLASKKVATIQPSGRCTDTNPATHATDRLVKYYSPSLYHIVEPLLSFITQPRATPLADKFVLDTSAQTHASPFTLLDRLHQRKNGGDLEQIDIAAECLDHMVAGIDTTGDALCFLMYQLSLPSSATFQRKLQAELAANPDHDETPFDKLPYLDAIVQEGLRCFPAIPMSLPRYVPSGGRHVDVYFMPEGTIVSCQGKFFVASRYRTKEPPIGLASDGILV